MFHVSASCLASSSEPAVPSLPRASCSILVFGSSLCNGLNQISGAQHTQSSILYPNLPNLGSYFLPLLSSYWSWVGNSLQSKIFFLRVKKPQLPSLRIKHFCEKWESKKLGYLDTHGRAESWTTIPLQEGILSRIYLTWLVLKYPRVHLGKAPLNLQELYQSEVLEDFPVLAWGETHPNTPSMLKSVFPGWDTTGEHKLWVCLFFSTHN